MTRPTQDTRDDSWVDTGILFGAAVVALFIGGVVELWRLPGRLWKAAPW